MSRVFQMAWRMARVSAWSVGHAAAQKRSSNPLRCTWSTTGAVVAGAIRAVRASTTGTCSTDGSGGGLHGSGGVGGPMSPPSFHLPSSTSSSGHLHIPTVAHLGARHAPASQLLAKLGHDSLMPARQSRQPLFSLKTESAAAS